MKQKVIIVEKYHPHYGELAEVTVSEEGTVTVHNMFGKKTIKVKLISCPHKVDASFVGVKGVKAV